MFELLFMEFDVVELEYLIKLKFVFSVENLLLLVLVFFMFESKIVELSRFLVSEVSLCFLYGSFELFLFFRIIGSGCFLIYL